jgi:hypothetical protein
MEIMKQKQKKFTNATKFYFWRNETKFRCFLCSAKQVKFRETTFVSLFLCFAKQKKDAKWKPYVLYTYSIHPDAKCPEWNLLLQIDAMWLWIRRFEHKYRIPCLHVHGSVMIRLRQLRRNSFIEVCTSASTTNVHLYQSMQTSEYPRGGGLL